MKRNRLERFLLRWVYHFLAAGTLFVAIAAREARPGLAMVLAVIAVALSALAFERVGGE